MGAIDRTREDVDTIFSALSHHRRRYVLHCLWEYETPMKLADLADEVAIRENERPLTEISAEEVKRLYFSLYHGHVPKLEDAGLVQYNQDRDEVRIVQGLERTEGWGECVDVGAPEYPTDR